MTKIINSGFTEWGCELLSVPAKSVPVSQIKTKEFQKTIDYMFRRIAGNGVGLAANQIGIPMSIAVIHIQPTKTRPNIASVPITAIINPKLVNRSKELQYGWEGCMSCPGAGLFFYVPRAKSVKVSYFNRDGEKIIRTVSDFEAIVFQHEIGHLNGIVCGEQVLVVNGKVVKGAIISRNEFMGDPDRVPIGAKKLVKIKK